MENIKDPILQIKDVCISYTSDVMAVKHVSADIEKNTITAIMGPSGCGKSTLLRAVNRMHELYKNIRVTGEILLNGENVLQMHPHRYGVPAPEPVPDHEYLRQRAGRIYLEWYSSVKIAEG